MFATVVFPDKVRPEIMPHSVLAPSYSSNSREFHSLSVLRRNCFANIESMLN